MIRTKSARRGAFVAPHHLAGQTGLAVLREGGNAIEAMAAAAATVAVVYPYANGIGGDAFWLVGEAGQDPLCIDAAGAAAQLATPEFYRQHQLDTIPKRGPLVANTVAGTISGWQLALELAAKWGGRLPLSRLLEDAIHYAGQGFPVAENHARSTCDFVEQLRTVPGFAQTFLDGSGQPVPAATMWTQKALAGTFERLIRAGLDDFYRGDIARAHAAGLEKVGAPLRLEDFESHRAQFVTPLQMAHSAGRLFNMTAPTQGVTSLMVLGIFDRLGCRQAEGFDYLHLLVEAIKQAFVERDLHVGDPSMMKIDAQAMLDPAHLDRLAARIDRGRAAPWPPRAPGEGDTIWMGCIDGEGRTVSFIQSVYFQYGSGVVIPETGVLWQNRGAGFTLEDGHVRQVRPGKKPYHTLNPAYARLKDGRTIAYGTMGGEGQPQTQAAMFTRYVDFGQSLQAAVTAPRWFLGRTTGGQTDTLKVESRFDPAVLEALRRAGHDVEPVGPYENMMGHAGMLVLHPSGVIEAAGDPRSDGGAVGF
ncbi:MAG: gamma-glutamyltransferase family protein [Reyranellaceae bacterium]